MNQGTPVLKAVSDPRTTDAGDTLVFTLQFGDGSATEVAVMAGALPAIVHSLKTFGARVEAVRRQLPADVRRDEIVVPYVATAIRVGRGADNSVVLQANTKQGIPVILSMPTSLALEAATKLQKEAQTTRTPGRS
jgi:hypothetical protein